LWWPFWKWCPVEIFQCREYILDIIIYPHMKCRWNRTMLNLCGIVVAILKMATTRNCSMSGINSEHHYLPTYQMLMISDNVEFWWPFWKFSYVGRLWYPELILGIEKFLPVAIFKMAATMPHKFHIVWFQRPELIPAHMKWRWNRTMLNLCVLWWPFWKWRPVENFQCR
jgi:hypothetical protein